MFVAALIPVKVTAPAAAMIALDLAIAQQQKNMPAERTTNARVKAAAAKTPARTHARAKAHAAYRYLTRHGPKRVRVSKVPCKMPARRLALYPQKVNQSIR